jgi:hypothetical protein
LTGFSGTANCEKKLDFVQTIAQLNPSKKQEKEVTVTTLPDKPSELIRLALKDLREVEAMPHYKVDMGYWHGIPTGEKECLVCLAGAVMARHLGANPALPYFPDNYSTDLQEKLHALNSLRQGYVYSGCKHLDCSTDLGDRFVCEYDTDKERFYADMELLANDLEAEGN